MEKTIKNMWIIVDKKGAYMITSLAYYRNTCIETWLEGSEMKWKDARKKYGWDCVKVDLKLSPHSSRNNTIR